jgi:transposase
MTVLNNRALSRTRLTGPIAEQPACIVAMEVCATAHQWGRVTQHHEHEVLLISAAYVQPFVKPQKEDCADAAATTEAELRRPCASLR